MNGPRGDTPIPGRPRVLPDLLRRRAAEDPGSVALIVHGGGSLTYGTWDRRSDEVARGLVGRGVRRGDRVALLFDNARWTDFAVCYLATHKAGAVAVPLAPRFSRAELAHVLAHCAPTAVVCPPDLAPEQEPASGWVASPDEVIRGQRSDPFQADLAGGDLAEVLYTSGTTGTAKGVACTHDNLLFHELPAEQAAAGAGHPAICFLHAFPVGTNAGQEVLRHTLRRRATTAVVLGEFDPERLAAAVAEHRVTRLQLVPAMARMIVDSGVEDRHDLSTIERVTLSSAPMPPALLRRLAGVFPNASLWNAYALTESGTARTLMGHAGARPGSVGQPVGGSEVLVVDEAGDPLVTGQTGEVWLRRVGAPRREYYRDPEATRAAFSGDWLRTGDVGYLDADGYLYLVDRKKDIIIRGGANVSSSDVENVLYEHPAVMEAAVFGVAHKVLGQDVAAAVVVRSPTTERELQAFVRGRVAEQSTPHQIFFVDHLPRNASGKVLKRELAAAMALRAEGDGEPSAAPVVPRTALERTIVDLWEEVLATPGIGVHDDFFQLGGHSLSATQVAGRLGDVLQLDVPPTAVFEFPTVAELASALGDLGRPAVGP